MKKKNFQFNKISQKTRRHNKQQQQQASIARYLFVKKKSHVPIALCIKLKFKQSREKKLLTKYLTFNRRLGGSRQNSHPNKIK